MNWPWTIACRFVARLAAPRPYSDEHVMAMTRDLETIGMSATSIGQVSMVGDLLRVQLAGESGKTVLLDISKPESPMQDSVHGMNILDQQQSQQLAHKQNNPTQDDLTPKAMRM
jgi:hypothetical protein